MKQIIVILIITLCINTVATSNVSIGSLGYSNRHFHKPMGIAIWKQSLLIVDNGNHRIQKYSPNQHYELSFKQIRDEDGELSILESPHSLVVNLSGQVFISDPETSKIYIFNRYGKYLSSLGKFGHLGVRFNEPLGLAIDKYDNLYIADSGNNRILKLDHTGRRLLNIPASEGNLKNPTDIELTASDEIIVLDNKGVKFYDTFGKHINTLPLTGNTFAIDSNSSIYIANNHSLTIYNSTGNILSTTTHNLIPQDMLIDRNKLYISDSKHHQVIIREIIAKWRLYQ